MRTAISSLILAAGLATAAYAQAPEAQQPAATPDAAADPAPSAVPTTPVEVGPSPAAPAQAQPPAAPAEPAPPPPALPTAGDAAMVLSALENVCVPAVRGRKLDDVAKAQGFRLNRREQTWTKPLGGDRNYQIIVFPQGSNKDVCFAELRFAIGQETSILQALNVWAFVHEPPLEPTANYTQPQDPDGLKRVRRSWEHLSSDRSIGLNFSTVRKPDDSPLNARYDTATLQYQERSL